MLLLPLNTLFPPRPLYALLRPARSGVGLSHLPCCSSAASGNSRGSLSAYSCRRSSSRSRSASLRRQGISSLGLRLLSRAWGAQGVPRDDRRDLPTAPLPAPAPCQPATVLRFLRRGERP